MVYFNRFCLKTDKNFMKKSAKRQNNLKWIVFINYLKKEIRVKRKKIKRMKNRKKKRNL